jgi:hypothetical protein
MTTFAQIRTGHVTCHIWSLGDFGTDRYMREGAFDPNPPVLGGESASWGGGEDGLGRHLVPPPTQGNSSFCLFLLNYMTSVLFS